MSEELLEEKMEAIEIPEGPKVEDLRAEHRISRFRLIQATLDPNLSKQVGFLKMVYGLDIFVGEVPLLKTFLGLALLSSLLVSLLF